MNGQQGMMAGKHNHEHCVSCCVSGVSWTAVFVGALVGVGIAFLLNLFSVAIGLSAYSLNPDGMITLAIGGLVGMAIGIIVTMFVAGGVAGYLGRAHCYKRNLGVMYGFTTWCLVLIITAVTSAHFGRYLSIYTNFVSKPAIVAVVDEMPAPRHAAMGNSAPAPKVAVMDVMMSPASMGMGAFIIFILFALGALASCFGGHYGMSCRSCDDAKYGCGTKA